MNGSTTIFFRLLDNFSYELHASSEELSKVTNRLKLFFDKISLRETKCIFSLNRYSCL
jgi:hypothetical protein